MKYRKDFVTNSSSSSFICEICGRNESGFDLSLSDVGFAECVNGHIICEDELINYRDCLIEYIAENTDFISKNLLDEEKLAKCSDDEIRDYLMEHTDYPYDIPEIGCPICQFIEYSEHDLSRFLEKEYKVPRDEVFQKVKETNRRRRKLYDSEYITEVCSRFDLKPAEIVATFKDRFGTYSKFKQYLR